MEEAPADQQEHIAVVAGRAAALTGPGSNEQRMFSAFCLGVERRTTPAMVLASAIPSVS